MATPGPTTNRIGGMLSLTVDGNLYEARGNFRVTPGKVKREGIAGQDRPHGYTETPIVPQIQGDISIGNQLSLEQLEQVTDSTVQVQLANGVTYVLVQAWTKSAFEIDTVEGKFECVFQGITCEEMPSQ